MKIRSECCGVIVQIRQIEGKLTAVCPHCKRRLGHPDDLDENKKQEKK